MNNIKAIHIVGDSKWGGGGVVILRLAEMAKRLGWRVDVLTTDPTFQDVLRGHDIGIVDLDVIWRDIRPARDLCGLFALYRFLKKSDYDLVHTHTSKAGFVGRLAATFAGTPAVVHTAHGFAFHEGSRPLAIKAYSLLERVAAHACHRIVTVAEFHRDWALRLGIGDKDKIVAVPNGIPEDRVKVNTNLQSLRRSWRIRPDEFVILSTGRLAPQKGLEYLIEATMVLARSMTRPFKVVLAGDGPMRRELKQLAERLGVSDKVVFLGFQEDIGSLLAVCDLVALPTEREGLSIALLEAMAAGKPVVTTIIGSNVEVTRGNEAALLVPPRDAAALANAIALLANSPLLARQKAARARETYQAHYTEERMLKQYRHLYDEMLQSATAARAQTVRARV